MTIANPDWEALAVSYQPVAWSVAQKYAHILPIEDGKQYAMIGIINAAREFDPETAKVKFGTQAYIRGKCAIIDAIRSINGRYGQKYMPNADIWAEHEGEYESVDPMNLETRAVVQERAEVLQWCLNALPPNTRTAVSMRFASPPQTYVDIAKRLKTSESKVKLLIADALESLRDMLHERGIDSAEELVN